MALDLAKGTRAKNADVEAAVWKLGKRAKECAGWRSIVARVQLRGRRRVRIFQHQVLPTHWASMSMPLVSTLLSTRDQARQGQTMDLGIFGKRSKDSVES